MIWDVCWSVEGLRTFVAGDRDDALYDGSGGCVLRKVGFLSDGSRVTHACDNTKKKN